MFSATYLATILLLQTIAVFLTVIYIDLFHKPDTEPIPDWLDSLARHVLGPLACVCCKSGNQTRVSPASSENNDLDQDEENMSTIKARNFMTSPVPSDDNLSLSTKEHKSYTWKEIVVLLDKATMYLYLLIILLGTTSFVGVLLGNYFAS